MIKALGWIVGLLLCFSVAAGFAGRMHPAGDTLSLFRMPLGALCLLAAALFWRRALAGVLLLSAGVAAATTLPMWIAGQGGGTVTLYSKNLWYRNPKVPEVAADIIESGAEIVALQEVSVTNGDILTLLATEFPHQHHCDFNGWNGIAVLSKHPIVETRCSTRRGVAAARLDMGGAEVWAASIHLSWPYPYDHEAALHPVLDVLESLEGEVVIGGDFNIFPWASSVRAIRAATGTRLAGPIRPTFELFNVPLLLDHSYAPGGGSVRYRPKLGSDHLGVLANLRVDRP